VLVWFTKAACNWIICSIRLDVARFEVLDDDPDPVEESALDDNPDPVEESEAVELSDGADVVIASVEPLA
jgi:hypothetical protein